MSRASEAQHVKRRRPRARGEPLSRPAWPRRPSSSRWVPGLRERRRGKGGSGAGVGGTLGPLGWQGGQTIWRRDGQWAGLTREPGSGAPGLAVQILTTVLRGTAELRIRGASTSLGAALGCLPASLTVEKTGRIQDNKGLLSLTTEGKRHILLTAFNCCGTIQLLVRGSLGCERLWGAFRCIS